MKRACYQKINALGEVSCGFHTTIKKYYPMKTSMKLILGLLFVTLSLQGIAQEPKPVYSIVRQIHDFDWYEQQAKAWKKEIDNGAKDNMAWVYWFQANRMASKFCDPKKWQSKIGNYFVTESKLIEMAEKAIPRTFEYYYLKTFEDNIPATSKSIEYITKAQELKPYDNLILPLLVNHYQFTNDKVNLEITCKKWYDKNEIPQELLITAYNNLISLEPNAILLTYGDNDTYPYWVLQFGQNIRPDVLVLSISLATHYPEYRQKKFEEINIPSLVFKNDSDVVDRNLFYHIVTNVTTRSIYVSIFADWKVYKDFANKMYFVGLSMKYSPKPFNNMAVLKNNIENKYMLDFLKRTFYNNPSESVCKMFNAVYVASFIKLTDYYKQSGEPDKAKKMKELAIIIAKDSGNTEWLKDIDN